MRYKVWLEIEEIDDDQDHYEQVGGPVCISDFATYAEAMRHLKALATLWPEAGNEDYAYPLEEGVL